MTISGGKKCHVCLEKRYPSRMVTCDFCGHNTCIREYCLTAVLRDKMCRKCRIEPEHRTLKEVQVA